MHAVSPAHLVWDAEDSGKKDLLPRIMAEALFSETATHKIQSIIKGYYQDDKPFTMAAYLRLSTAYIVLLGMVYLSCNRRAIVVKWSASRLMARINRLCADFVGSRQAPTEGPPQSWSAWLCQEIPYTRFGAHQSGAIGISLHFLTQAPDVYSQVVGSTRAVFSPDCLCQT